MADADESAYSASPEDKYWHRSSFPSAESYAYWMKWRSMLLREAEKFTTEIPDDATPQDILKEKTRAGVCVLKVYLDPSTHSATLPHRARCVFKSGDSVLLSRRDPESERSACKLVLDKVNEEEHTLIFPHDSSFPEDATQGVWRLDLVKDWHLITQQMNHVLEFCLKDHLPLHHIVIHDMLLEPDRLGISASPKGLSSGEYSRTGRVGLKLFIRFGTSKLP